MPLHDYGCFVDGTILTDQYRSVEEGAQAHPPLCPVCGNQMAWVPQVGRMDAFEPGQEFTMYDGQNRPVLVESFAQMRQIEQESEQQARNGEGQPIRFRALHQNRSNMQDNTFGEMGGERPTAAGKRKFGLQNAAKPLPTEIDGTMPDRAFGPGVDDTNCSALKD